MAISDEEYAERFAERFGPQSSGGGEPSGLGRDLATATKKTGLERQEFDITRSLGLEREQKAYITRLNALVDPKGYSGQRATAWDKMTRDVRTYFDDTIAYLSKAGFGWDEAKDEAKKLTAEMAKIERLKLELVFPTNANIIGAQSLVRAAHAEQGMLNPAELTAAAHSGGHIDAAPKKRAPRKAKK